MAETQGQVPVAIASSETRTLALIVYALYLLAFCNGITAVIGVVIAYIKRDESRGTIWGSHFENQINAFWAALILFVVGILTSWLIIGIFVMIAAGIYFLYRSLRGLIRAVESQPY